MIVFRLFGFRTPNQLELKLSSSKHNNKYVLCQLHNTPGGF